MEKIIEILNQYKITIEKQEDHLIWTQGHFCIEVENNQLFRLLHMGDVIAPFNDPHELCQFIVDHTS